MEMTSSSPSNNNTVTSSSSPTPPPQTPNKPQEITGNINNNPPYATTFVQADTSNFKQVVQLLTGSSSSTTNNNNSSIPPIKSTPQKKQGFKLYERRNSLKNGFLMINTSASADQQHRCSPRELLSPSILDFPSLVLSPIKAPEKDLSCKESSSQETSSPDLLLDQEEIAIAEKKFYLSPRTENVEKPQLLTLFPLTSPRVSSSSS